MKQHETLGLDQRLDDWTERDGDAALMVLLALGGIVLIGSAVLANDDAGRAMTICSLGLVGYSSQIVLRHRVATWLRCAQWRVALAVVPAVGIVVILFAALIAR